MVENVYKIYKNIFLEILFKDLFYRDRSRQWPRVEVFLRLTANFSCEIFRDSDDESAGNTPPGLQIFELKLNVSDCVSHCKSECFTLMSLRVCWFKTGRRAGSAQTIALRQSLMFIVCTYRVVLSNSCLEYRIAIVLRFARIKVIHHGIKRSCVLSIWNSVLVSWRSFFGWIPRQKDVMTIVWLAVEFSPGSYGSISHNSQLYFNSFQFYSIIWSLNYHIYYECLLFQL